VDSSDHLSVINPFSDLGKETQNPCLDSRIRIWIFPKKRTLSSCGEQTCDHAIIFFKRGVKPTVREATQNSSHLKGRLGSIVHQRLRAEKQRDTKSVY